ncbi:GNAT family N-acetyltransferase [Denitromonas sp.]|uniref:GNAT family N-acetyltransferase n=1 Tax=Denitromonas sp. TaxID=2734609 RepID=UPI002AFE4129|nr:GNAT family N-acetyltransferase [Denitromonas sp.]
MPIDIALNRPITSDEVLALYRAVKWSAADKPAALMAALRGSHSLVTARSGRRLVGLGNAISDGHLVVYFPHLLVHPEFRRQGVGRQMMAALLKRYAGFHQQMLTADSAAVPFYHAMGFERAGSTEPMWIYAGTEH